MNNKELSREFNLMYNNIMSNQAPGLNEYEKSLVLTEAQEMIVTGLYNGTAGSMTFEQTEEVTAYLAALVDQVAIEEKRASSEGSDEETAKMPLTVSKDSYLFEIPSYVMFITYENCTIADDSFCGDKHERTVAVVPVTQDEYHRTSRNPFKGSNTNRVLRLSHSDGTNRLSELISKYGITSYNVRFIRKPSPIVLENLPKGLSIDGVNDCTECKLPPFLHRKLLMQAVSLAKSYWS